MWKGSLKDQWNIWVPMYVPRRIKFHEIRKNRDKHLPQPQQKRRRKNKLLFNSQQIKVAQSNLSFLPSLTKKPKHDIFNQHFNVTGECKGIYEVFLKGSNFIMVHQCVENVSLTRLYWKSMTGTIKRNHLLHLE